MVIWEDGYAVVELVGVGVGGIVNKHHIFEVPVYYSQIFYVHALGAEVAVLAEESVMDPLVFGVQVIDYYIGVACVAGGEDDDLEIFAEVFEDLLGVGADVDACFNELAGGKFDGQFDVVGRVEVVIAVNEGLVQIEDYCFFI